MKKSLHTASAFHCHTRAHSDTLRTLRHIRTHSDKDTLTVRHTHTHINSHSVRHTQTHSVTLGLPHSGALGHTQGFNLVYTHFNRVIRCMFSL